MKVKDVMKLGIETCRAEEPLSRAAQIMWDHDCGAVPVVDDAGRVTGIVTDRDVCMAAYTQGRPLAEIATSVACAKSLITIHPEQSLDDAESLMQGAQIRRLPVVDDEGRLEGMLTLGDLAQRAHGRQIGKKADGLSTDDVARTLAAISQPHAVRAG